MCRSIPRKLTAVSVPMFSIKIEFCSHYMKSIALWRHTGSHRGIITSRADVDFISVGNSCSACVLINTTSALYRLAATTLEV